MIKYEKKNFKYEDKEFQFQFQERKQTIDPPTIQILLRPHLEYGVQFWSPP